MKIVLADIKSGNKVFSLEESIQFQDESVKLKADIKAEVVLSYRKDDAYGLRGDMVARVDSSCGRCGVTVHLTLEQNFHYQVLLKEEPLVESEYECTNENFDLLYLAEPFIETKDVLSEQFVLALPVQMLCAEDCKGLCDQCGTNLNRKSCNCGEISKNSPFAILKDL